MSLYACICLKYYKKNIYVFDCAIYPFVDDWQKGGEEFVFMFIIYACLPCLRGSICCVCIYVVYDVLIGI